MAKHIITHTCGHQVEVALFGRTDDRARRIDAMSREGCPACRAAGSDLVGSVKQVAWATDIRAALAPKIAAAHDALVARLTAQPVNPALPDGEAKLAAVIDAVTARRDELLGRRAATDWIEGRAHDGRVDLYEAAKAAMRAALEG